MNIEEQQETSLLMDPMFDVIFRPACSLFMCLRGSALWSEGSSRAGSSPRLRFLFLCDVNLWLASAPPPVRTGGRTTCLNDLSEEKRG